MPHWPAASLSPPAAAYQGGYTHTLWAPHHEAAPMFTSTNPSFTFNGFPSVPSPFPYPGAHTHLPATTTLYPLNGAYRDPLPAYPGTYSDKGAPAPAPASPPYVANHTFFTYAPM